MAKVWHWLAIAALLYSVAILLIQFISRDGLRGDEAALALNLVRRSYAELLQPLDFNQGAPVGFLFLEKFATQVFGNSEYALRFFPLLASIGSLVMLYGLGKRWLSPPALPLAIVMLGMLRRIVFHAVEAKQYASDIAIALILLLLSLRANQDKVDTRWKIAYAVTGAIAVWFSHPAVFILAGVELAHWLALPKVNIVDRIKAKLPTYLAWLVSFGGFYWIAVRSLNENSDLMTSWSNGFPSSPFDIIWVFDALGRMFFEPLSFVGPFDAVAIACFVFGCIAFYRKNRLAFWLCVAPILVTLAASFLQKYPFRGRLLLFLAPTILLAIAQGAYSTVAWFYDRVRTKPAIAKLIAVAIGSVLTICLYYVPLSASARLPFQPKLDEGLPKVLDYIHSQQQPEDTLYVFQKAQYQFLYYTTLDRYNFENYVIGVEELNDGQGMSDAEAERYAADLDRLGDRDRVWLVFSLTSLDDEIRFLRRHFNSYARQIDEVHALNAHAYLFQKRGS